MLYFIFVHISAISHTWYPLPICHQASFQTNERRFLVALHELILSNKEHTDCDNMAYQLLLKITNPSQA